MFEIAYLQTPPQQDFGNHIPSDFCAFNRHSIRMVSYQNSETGEEMPQEYSVLNYPRPANTSPEKRTPCRLGGVTNIRQSRTCPVTGFATLLKSPPSSTVGGNSSYACKQHGVPSRSYETWFGLLRSKDCAIPAINGTLRRVNKAQTASLSKTSPTVSRAVPI